MEHSYQTLFQYQTSKQISIKTQHDIENMIKRSQSPESTMPLTKVSTDIQRLATSTFYKEKTKQNKTKQQNQNIQLNL